MKEDERPFTLRVAEYKGGDFGIAITINDASKELFTKPVVRKLSELLYPILTKFYSDKMEMIELLIDQAIGSSVRGDFLYDRLTNKDKKEKGKNNGTV